MDTSYAIEHLEYILSAEFQEQIVVPKNAQKAKDDGLKHIDSESEMSLWTDEFRLDFQRAGAGIAWKKLIDQRGYRKVYLGKNKEVLDAELYAADQALDVAIRRGQPRAIIDPNVQIFFWKNSQKFISVPTQRP